MKALAEHTDAAGLATRFAGTLGPAGHEFPKDMDTRTGARMRRRGVGPGSRSRGVHAWWWGRNVSLASH